MFENLKVLELASVLAGPDVGMFFAEQGAKVIKVENKLTNGDVTRQWKLGSENQENAVSAYYSSVNWNKQILFYDLTNYDDKNEVYELVKTADVIIVNFKPGDAEKLGSWISRCALSVEYFILSHARTHKDGHTDEKAGKP